MVPSAFVMLEALPLTPNGKIDRRALPAPEGDAVVRGEYVAPRTPTEEVLAAIWCEVLKLDRVGIARQLLRAWRALAAGDAGDGADARALPGRVAVAGVVRGAERW